MSEKYLKQLWIYDQKPPLQNHKIKMHYFRFDGFSFGGLLEYILQHTLAKFQPAMTCNSQNTSQNTQKHQKHAILLSKPVALYIHCWGDLFDALTGCVLAVVDLVHKCGSFWCNCSPSAVQPGHMWRSSGLKPYTWVNPLPPYGCKNLLQIKGVLWKGVVGLYCSCVGQTLYDPHSYLPFIHWLASFL